MLKAPEGSNYHHSSPWPHPSRHLSSWLRRGSRDLEKEEGKKKKNHTNPDSAESTGSGPSPGSTRCSRFTDAQLQAPLSAPRVPASE